MQMRPRYCQYCGAELSDGCDCAREAAEYERELVERLEDEQMHSAWQQDLIDIWRYER